MDEDPIIRLSKFYKNIGQLRRELLDLPASGSVGCGIDLLGIREPSNASFRLSEFHNKEEIYSFTLPSFKGESDWICFLPI